MLEHIDVLVVGLGGVLVSIIGLEIGQYKIMLDTRSTAETAADRSDRNGDRLENVERDINGMALTLVRETDAEVAVADGGEVKEEDDDTG